MCVTSELRAKEWWWRKFNLNRKRNVIKWILEILDSRYWKFCRFKSSVDYYYYFHCCVVCRDLSISDERYFFKQQDLNFSFFFFLSIFLLEKKEEILKRKSIKILWVMNKEWKNQWNQIKKCLEFFFKKKKP